MFKEIQDLSICNLGTDAKIKKSLRIDQRIHTTTMFSPANVPIVPKLKCDFIQKNKLNLNLL